MYKVGKMQATREPHNTALGEILTQLPKLATSEEKGTVLDAILKLMSSQEDRQMILRRLGLEKFGFSDFPTNKDGSDVRIFNGGRTPIYAKQVSTKDGETEIWGYVGRGPGVMVTPVVMEGNEPMIVLFEQIRPKHVREDIEIGGPTIEIPAGILKPGRSYYDTAREEILEEIGYKAIKLIPSGVWAMAPAYTDEFQVHYIALVEPANSNENHDDDRKYILDKTIRLYSLEEAQEMVNSGRINDIRTVAAINNLIANKGIISELLRK